VTRLDDSTVAAAQAGEQSAFREVYETLAPAVTGYLRSHGATDPEGLTSEVFLALFRTLPRLRGGASGLRTFTFSVAHARLVDEHRARSRMPVHTAYDPAQDPRVSRSAETEALDRWDAPDGVLALVAALGEAQREVVTLRVVAGLSLEETAAVIGRSVGSVKQLQRRALLSLKALASERGVTP
jgi:RNA polymerase sigma-70 factor (ECF subfamily)